MFGIERLTMSKKPLETLAALFLCIRRKQDADHLREVPLPYLQWVGYRDGAPRTGRFGALAQQDFARPERFGVPRAALYAAQPREPAERLVVEPGL